MLEFPGLVNPSILEQWIEDLETNGVLTLANAHDPTERHPVCPHDADVLSLAADGLMSSCTEGLKDHLSKMCVLWS